MVGYLRIFILILVCFLPFREVLAGDEEICSTQETFGFEESFDPILQEVSQTNISTPDPLIEAMLSLPVCDRALELGARNGLMSAIDDGGNLLSRIGRIHAGLLQRRWALTACLLGRCDRIEDLVRSDLARMRQDAGRAQAMGEMALIVTQTPIPVLMGQAYSVFTAIAREKWSNFDQKPYLEKVQLTCEFMGEAGFEAAVGLLTGGSGAAVRNGLRAGRLSEGAAGLLRTSFERSARNWEPPRSFASRYRLQRRRGQYLRTEWDSDRASSEIRLLVQGNASPREIQGLRRQLTAHNERRTFQNQQIQARGQTLSGPEGRRSIQMRSSARDPATGRPQYEVELESGRVLSMSRAQRESLRLQIDSSGRVRLPDFRGLGAEVDGGPVRRGQYIFVMDEAGSIFVAPNARNIRHSSFFGARGRVAAAGELTIENGQITYINDSSGHFYPPMELTLQFLERLRAQGVALPDRMDITSTI